MENSSNNMKYSTNWDLSSIPEDVWNSEHGRRNAAKRVKPTGGVRPGAGRPKKARRLLIPALLSCLAIPGHAQPAPSRTIEVMSPPTISAPPPTIYVPHTSYVPPPAKLTPGAQTITLTDYVPTIEQEPALDKHGKPKLDRKGNPKMLGVQVSKPVTRTLEAHTAKVVDARNVNYLQRTDYQYQYNYVSHACLNTWWCHLVVGDPTAEATARPVYSDYTFFAFEDTGTGDIYVAGQAGSHLLGFAINSRVQYAVDSGNLAVIDNQGNTHQIGIIQKILKPTGQQ
jgi:hypothetical protein